MPWRFGLETTNGGVGFVRRLPMIYPGGNGTRLKTYKAAFDLEQPVSVCFTTVWALGQADLQMLLD